MTRSSNPAPDPASGRRARSRQPVRNLLRRLTVAATTGGLLLLAAPASVEVAAHDSDSGARLRLLGAHTHHHTHHHAHPRAHPRWGRAWPGHPGRRIVRYRVRPGDTATGLAVRFHAWTAELIAVNHLSARSTLYAGERVRIPVVVAALRKARHRHHRPHHRAPHHRAHHHRAHHHRAHHHRAHHRSHHKAHHHKAHHHKAHHHPWRHDGASRAKVRHVVVRLARRYHVGPSLALAIAWQESGWQQHRLSSSHAVGAMQVLPATGRWLSRYYVGRSLNLYALHDNVRAGVVLIGILRDQTGLRRTVAGYYQGLASVRAFGMYDSTRAYVRNVLAIRKRLEHGWNPA